MKTKIPPSGKNRHEFPKNSRSIPEKKNLLASIVQPIDLFYICLYVFVIAAIALLGIEFVRDLQNYNNLKANQQKIKSDLSFWEQAKVQYPNSRDVYFHIASDEYQLGQTYQAEQDIEKSLSIDPNFQAGKRLEDLIQK